ncbi:MAG: DNA polymerase III subunit delta [Thermodesulfobacteriota bacterium]
MTVYRRADLPDLLAAIREGLSPAAVLVVGERYLGRTACEDLVAALLPDAASREHALTTMDGEQEDVAAMIRVVKTFSLFGGRRVLRVLDTRLFHSRTTAKSVWDQARRAMADGDRGRALSRLGQILAMAGLLGQADGLAGLRELPAKRWAELFGFPRPTDLEWLTPLAADLATAPAAAATGSAEADRLEAALAGGLPAGNTLILVAEEADRRKKLYKYVEQAGVILDLTVDTGLSAAAKEEQAAVCRELLEKTLADMGKTMEPAATAALLERVGFHPVAVVRETEKVALATGDARRVSLADVNALVSRTREEAMFELTGAVAEGKVEAALLVCHRLLDQGQHPLALIAALRGQVRRLLLLRAFQLASEPPYRERMAYGVFQKAYLPQLKASRPQWAEILAGHPYALYRQFLQVEGASLARWRQGLAAILIAESRLKGSDLPAAVVLDDLIWQLATRNP